MDQLLTNFIRALRNADIRVSTAETLDAFSTVQLIGYGDRQLLKDSLELVLPKTLDEKAAFDTCFDQFFSFRSHSDLPPPQDGDSAQNAAAAGNGEVGGGGESQSTGGDSKRGGEEQASAQQSQTPAEMIERGEMSSPHSALGQLLTRANSLEINIAINTAGQRMSPMSRFNSLSFSRRGNRDWL